MTTITLNLQTELTLKGESEAQMIRTFHRFLTHDMGDANHTLTEPTEEGGEWLFAYDADGVVFHISFTTFRGLIDQMLGLPSRSAKFDVFNFLTYNADYEKTESCVTFSLIKNVKEEN